MAQVEAFRRFPGPTVLVMFLDAVIERTEVGRSGATCAKPGSAATALAALELLSSDSIRLLGPDWLTGGRGARGPVATASRRPGTRRKNEGFRMDSDRLGSRP